MKRITPLIAVFTAVAALVTAQVQAATIFSHSFGGGTTDLNGTAVDVGTGNWVAGANFDANGDVNISTANPGSATLAFTPTDGLIYTLTVTLGAMTTPASDTDWVGIGFAAGQSDTMTPGDRFVDNAVVAKAWMMNRGSGATAGTNQAFLGSGGNGTFSSASWTTDSTTFGGNMDLRVVLDTTGGSGSWTATWYADTGSGFNVVRATTTLADENINSVGFAVSGGDLTGSVTSFSLTSIPEPSSLSLIGLGTLLLLRRRRLPR